MSLISEALRKARQEEAQREALRRGTGVPVSFGSPRRRPWTAIVLLTTLALAAGLAGATIFWWVTRQQVTAPAGGSPQHADTATVPGEPGAAPKASQVPPPSPGSGGEGAATADSGGAAEHPDAGLRAPVPGPEAPDAAGQRDFQGLGSAVNVAPHSRVAAAGSHGKERSFVLTAELGYASLRLDYIVHKPSAPWAGINGQRVEPGSTVDGFVVEEIAADFVRLRDDRGPVVLRVH